MKHSERSTIIEQSSDPIHYFDYRVGCNLPISFKITISKILSISFEFNFDAKIHYKEEKN